MVLVSTNSTSSAQEMVAAADTKKLLLVAGLSLPRVYFEKLPLSAIHVGRMAAFIFMRTQTSRVKMLIFYSKLEAACV